MKSQYLKDEFHKIDQSMQKIRNLAINNEELAPVLTSYFLVFICGIYENIVEHLFVQRAGKTEDKEIENFMREIMATYFRSPSYEQIKNLVKRLKGETFELKADPKSIEGLSQIVQNRRKVAHGEYSDATLNDCAIWHKQAKIFFGNIEKILLGYLDGKKREKMAKRKSKRRTVHRSSVTGR